MDSLKLPIYRYDVLKRLSRCALDKVNQLFVLSYSDDFCGGGNGNAFIAIVEGKLTEIATTEVSYDDEPGAEGSSSKFYLPVKFDNGKVLLIPDGNLDNPELLKQSNGSLDTYPVPERFSGQPENLVVEVITTSHAKLIDKNKEEPEPEDFTYTYTEKVQYHLWDGKKLVKVD